jgi:tRNA (mo5U34)-methyltransferase
MRFESLREALNPADPARTVEDHPAPIRAVLLGKA